MSTLDLNRIFSGTILIIAPHMDDEVLGCGGLIAKLNRKERIYLVYATDGMRSPVPVMPGDSSSPDLGKIRVLEAISAMKCLGVPERNLRFLNLPEAELKKYIPTLTNKLSTIIEDIHPDIILIPFRYDRHPDHLAINQVITAGGKRFNAQIVEYFIYHRWRLLPKKDIRKYIKPDCLVKVDIANVSASKRKALDLFVSQTTHYYPWQTRPILTPLLLDEESRNPEYFLFFQPALQGPAIFIGDILWIRLAHRIEPYLQKWKYISSVYLKKVFRNGK